jgi:acetolactate synthase-1/2/3 large subunit
MRSVANLLVETLIAHGVSVVFGLPGGENLPLLETLRQNDVGFILVKNEGSALFMADVTARLTGVPGVALVTLGPGAANAYLGLAHAYLDRAPVLLISAQTERDLIPHHTHQVLDLQACFGPIVKHTCELTPQNAHQTIQKAFHMLYHGRPGPVHLSVGKQTLVAPPVPTLVPDIFPPKETFVEDDNKIQEALALLKEAQHPVIVVGLGLEPEKPYQALRGLVEALNAPLIDTPKSKGALPADHPLAAGTIGLTHTDPVYEILEEADCIVAIGFDVVELVRPWQYTTPLIWIATWENCDPVIPAAHEFVGPTEPVIQGLSQGCELAENSWGLDRVAALGHKLAQRHVPQPEEDRLLPQDVLSAIRAVMPRDALITTDVGSHKIFTALHWQALVPNRYMVSNGLSGMGFGLPAAIASARVLREPVVCVTGDGGLAMNLGELALLRDLALPVIIVMMNDGALDLIRQGQMNSDLPIIGTEFTNPDYGQIIEGFGLQFFHVKDGDGCARAIRAGLSSRQPTFVEAMIDPVGYRV